MYTFHRRRNRGGRRVMAPPTIWLIVGQRAQDTAYQQIFHRPDWVNLWNFIYKQLNIMLYLTYYSFYSRLLRHTPQSEGKRGLVTMRTTSCTGDQNWSRPIRFEIWIYCLATLYWRRACNAVGLHCWRLPMTCFVIIAFRRNNSLYAWSPDPLSLEITGCG